MHGVSVMGPAVVSFKKVFSNINRQVHYMTTVLFLACVGVCFVDTVVGLLWWSVHAPTAGRCMLLGLGWKCLELNKGLELQSVQYRQAACLDHGCQKSWSKNCNRFLTIKQLCRSICCPLAR